MDQQLVSAPAQAEVFAFGDPTPVLDGREILGMCETWFNGSYYEPPISFTGLSKALVANSHHGSAVRVKVNILASCFKPTKLLSRAAFKRAALDYVTYGNVWIERRDSWMGRPLELWPTLGKQTRFRKDGLVMMLEEGKERDFAAGSVWHLAQPDVNQELYGVPDYQAALQSAFLNESATLFRRRYYINGSHAGFILHMTDPAQAQEDVDAMRLALKEAKGPGNFRNLFMYTPGGKADGIKIIPIGEASAKDEFPSIKNVTRDDVLAAHRVPPQILGIIPNATGGFGDVEKAAAVFGRNEIQPMQDDFLALNDWLGEEAVAFVPYEVGARPAA